MLSVAFVVGSHGTIPSNENRDTPRLRDKANRPRRKRDTPEKLATQLKLRGIDNKAMTNAAIARAPILTLLVFARLSLSRAVGSRSSGGKLSCAAGSGDGVLPALFPTERK